ncbi:MAG: AIR synthase family protein [Armatimonadota bacterium]|nr:AIR synthase family protein [Armatimonadota bacterium]MCX7778353.1 AIR synthase family protein [Armatimonadota bacterium]MDW8025121.1 AIR synthase family protein [Armatimonadota bacterium]
MRLPSQFDFSTGKLHAQLLELLIGKLPLNDERVVVGPKVGEDAAVIDMGDRYLVAKTDPITFATDEIGWYAVNVNANDIAVMGAVPKWFMATVLLPEGRTDEALAEIIFSQIANACRELNITVIGGHTEVTYGLDRPIVVGAMLGEVDKERLVVSSNAQVGDVIILTKGIPIEGTSIIAREKREELLMRGYDAAFIERAKRMLYDPGISVVRDALIATSSGRVHAMHDPTEGGLATGLYELSWASGVSIEVEQGAIHILEEGKRLCDEFGLNPLGTIASGALLIVAHPDDGDRIVNALTASGISAVIIGRITAIGNDVTLKRGNECSPMPLFVKDEIAKLF